MEALGQGQTLQVIGINKMPPVRLRDRSGREAGLSLYDHCDV